MRSFQANNKYNFILNLFTSFGYFDNDSDNKKVLKNIDNSLKEKGIFILDFINTKKAIKELKEFEEKNINNINFKIEKYYDKKFIYKKIIITDQKKSHVFTEKVRILTQQHFTSYIKNLDINLLHVFGDYNFTEFNPLLSERLLLVFQKH